jgi:hypothetical protein
MSVHSGFGYLREVYTQNLCIKPCFVVIRLTGQTIPDAFGMEKTDFPMAGDDGPEELFL